MKVVTRNSQPYRLSGSLNPFQLDLQIHLINWKWRNITTEPGMSGKQVYDAILPEQYERMDSWPHLYPGIVAELSQHRTRNVFRFHPHFYHMASSQAANINLFLPLLLHPAAPAILSEIKPDFAALATGHLDNGYCIEYWGDNFADHSDVRNTGPLHDKTSVSGTDSDIAIAYYNHQDELCLWLIEHKLTEAEFTDCGGFRSKGRQPRHDCSRSFTKILASKATCYYHDINKFDYWNITDTHRDFFVNGPQSVLCPFQGGLNQLWRNQLLGLAIEQDQGYSYTHVYFSVVKHSQNTALDESLIKYKNLIDQNPKFSTFTSRDVINSVERLADPQLDHWANWYRGLYDI